MRVRVYIFVLLLAFNTQLKAVSTTEEVCSADTELYNFLMPFANNISKTPAFLDGDETAKKDVYLECISGCEQVFADRMLADAKDFKSLFNRRAVYCGYLCRKDLDPEEVNAIFLDVKTFTGIWKKDFYVFCFGLEAFDSSYVSIIFGDVKTLEDESCRAGLYEAYLKRGYVEAGHMNTVLEDVETFEAEVEKYAVYRAFLRRENASERHMEHILEQAKEFEDQGLKAELYQIYLDREDFNPKQVILMIQETAGIPELEQAKLDYYREYLKRPDVNAELVAAIHEDLKTFERDVPKGLLG